jgi:hypothetical protein
MFCCRYARSEVRMVSIMEIDKELLQTVFDVAVQSIDFASGFLADEEVEGLRSIARLLGIDEDVATPNSFKCKYDGKHVAYSVPKGNRNYVAGWEGLCTRCRKLIS